MGFTPSKLMQKSYEANIAIKQSSRVLQLFRTTLHLRRVKSQHRFWSLGQASKTLSPTLPIMQRDRYLAIQKHLQQFPNLIWPHSAQPSWTHQQLRHWSNHVQIHKHSHPNLCAPLCHMWEHRPVAPNQVFQVGVCAALVYHPLASQQHSSSESLQKK